MDIGIVTLWQSKDNYGQILQCYALQCYLKKQGHNAFLIRFNYNKNNSSFKKKLIKALLIYPMVKKMFTYDKRRKESELKRKNDKRNAARKFDEFRNLYISQTEALYYSLEDLKKNPPVADCYITGSDQVFGANLKVVDNSIFFLSFVPKSARKISYAASFGLIKYPQDRVGKLKELLDDFDFVSIREKAGVNICNSVGIPATKVLDPVFLLSSDDYLKFVKTSKYTSPYVYIYSLNIKLPNEIMWGDLSRMMANYKLVVTHSSGYFEGDEIFSNAVYDYSTISEWLSNIYFSSLFVTTSFHGVAFSILLKKKFVYFPLYGEYARANNRVLELLNILGLNFLVVKNTNDFEAAINTTIDWESVYGKLLPEIVFSRKMLIANL